MKIETKRNIGDTVWFIRILGGDTFVTSSEIVNLFVTVQTNEKQELSISEQYYVWKIKDVETMMLMDRNAYSTKAELLKSL